MELRNMTKKVRLGVIGLGYIGKKHAEIAAKMGECILVSVCDIDGNARNLAEELNIKSYADYEEMLEKEVLDGVIIAVPNNLHASVGTTCAQKGLHLLVEKPIASEVSDADILIERVKQCNVNLLVGHHKRFNPSIEAARNIIKGGETGRLVGVTILWAMLKPADYFQASWRRSKGGGPILINLIHDIDNLRYICGEITRVYAESSNQTRNFQVEDSASVSLRFENGALGNVFISDCVPSIYAYEATTGENPFIFQSSENCYYFFGTEATLTFPHLRKLFYPNPSKAGWQYPISVKDMKVKWSDPYENQLRHFCKVIRGEEAPRTTGEDAKRTLEATLAVLKSGETRQPISLK